MFTKLFATAIFVLTLSPAVAQTDWSRVVSGAIKAGQAMTISDDDLAKVVGE